MQERKRERKVLTVVPPISTTNAASPFTPGLFPDSNEARNAAPRIEFVGPDELFSVTNEIHTMISPYSIPILTNPQARTREKELTKSL